VVILEPLDEGHLETLVDPAPSPEAEVLRRDHAAQLRARVRDRLRGLRRRDRAIVVARHVAGRRVAELAHDHHINASRVSQLDARALRTLRRTWHRPLARQQTSARSAA
jgi:DNA-directed RNA polymerase specialized sigma24 family protein